MISKITYGTLAGQVAPLIGFDITLDGSEGTDPEIASYQQKITSSPYRGQILRVRGPYPSSDSMFKLLKPFHDAPNYITIIAITDGMVSYPWQMLINHTIIDLKTVPWPVLPCNEIHYPFPEDDSLPVLSSQMHKSTLAVIIPPAPAKGKNHTDAIFKLIAKTHGRWGVLHEPSKIWQKIIYSKED